MHERLGIDIRLHQCSAYVYLLRWEHRADDGFLAVD